MFAPVLAVSVDPPAPKIAPKIVTTVTQGASESASSKVVVTLPAGYAAPSTISTLPGCDAAAEQARACPEASRIGSTAATAAVLGLLPVDLSGGLYWGGARNNKLTVIALLDGGGQRLTLEGTVTPLASGELQTAFDNLPNITTTRLQLTFDGGARGIIANPVTCGTYVFSAQFTSHRGEQATSQAPVTITGCPPAAPKLTKLQLSKTRVRPAGQVVVRFSTDVAARVTARLGSLRRTIEAPAGRSVIFLQAPRKPGRHRVLLSAIPAAGGKATVRRITLTVLRR
jgi:hypothetical protein